MKKKDSLQVAEKKGEVEEKFKQEFVAEMVGVKDSEFALSLIASSGNALEPFVGKEEGIKAIMQSFRDLKPRDSMEARLISQSAVLFEFAMKSFKQCADATGLNPIESMANLGIKLMRVHNETVETLNRYRRGGEQKVTVTHAVLANQAVVNNNYGEGVSPKNKGDTSCPQENAELKPEPTTISHADSPLWPTGDADSMEGKVAVPKPKMVKRK